MKIHYSPYTLAGKPPFKDREGALLQVQFADGNIGYADVHPWHEFGDKPLAEQISLLYKGVPTSLTKRSLYFAKIDADARMAKINLFKHLIFPESHWLVTSPDEPIPEKFKTVKIKADPSTDLKKQLSSLPPDLKIRIDFNNKHTFESFSKWLPTISEFTSRIDFIEDPFPYDEDQWKTISVPLATDFQSEMGDIAIIKPAIEDLEDFKECERIIVTSYLDHPIGQLGAAYIAGILRDKHPKRGEVCGLLSHLIYQKNSFSERLSNDGPTLIATTGGLGFGYDDLLKKLSWKSM